jgi:hypothetical protein
MSKWSQISENKFNDSWKSFRLKYMQVVSLVSHDNFLSNYNISIPTDDFVETMKKFPGFWNVDNNRDEFGVAGNFTQTYGAKYLLLSRL